VAAGKTQIITPYLNAKRLQLKVSPENVVLVHDDIELSFGEVRRQDEGSARGHNGVRSVHKLLGTQKILRLRLGIGQPTGDMETSDFVLANFTSEEEKQLEETVIPQAVAEIPALVTSLRSRPE
jgi:peptidyl-tRNA hydrolase, PTH1 family